MHHTSGLLFFLGIGIFGLVLDCGRTLLILLVSTHRPVGASLGRLICHNTLEAFMVRVIVFLFKYFFVSGLKEVDFNVLNNIGRAKNRNKFSKNLHLIQFLLVFNLFGLGLFLLNQKTVLVKFCGRLGNSAISDY
jgi:hypothetical protein